MILKQTTIMECWCPNCQSGQTKQMLEKSFKEKKALEEYIGETFICQKCVQENKLEDVLVLIPEVFNILSQGSLLSKSN